MKIVDMKIVDMKIVDMKIVDMKIFRHENISSLKYFDIKENGIRCYKMILNLGFQSGIVKCRIVWETDRENIWKDWNGQAIYRDVQI
jgi:hypothetical protein